MTRAEFHTKIQDWLSEGCSVPLNVNERKLTLVINEAYKWFKDKYDMAHEHRYMIVSSENYKTSIWQQSRQIALPDCVVAVTKCQLPNRPLGVGDFSNLVERSFSRRHGNLAKYGMNAGGGRTDSLFYLMAKMHASYLNDLSLFTYSYEYNNRTNRLTIKGRDPQSNLLLEVYTMLSYEELFEDRLFFQYVLGKCYKSLGKVYGVVDMQLIGQLNISSGDLQSAGDDLIQEVNDDIENGQSADFFVFK